MPLASLVHLVAELLIKYHPAMLLYPSEAHNLRQLVVAVSPINHHPEMLLNLFEAHSLLQLIMKQSLKFEGIESIQRPSPKISAVGAHARL